MLRIPDRSRSETSLPPWPGEERRRVRAFRSALRGLSTVLIISGTLLMTDAGLTLVWQEPVSAFFAKLTQNRLSDELTDLEQTPPTALQLRTLARLKSDRQRIAFLARSLKREAKEGKPLGRIDLPKVSSRFVMVQGTAAASLRKGPGHYDDSPLPGQTGTVAVAGHRTTYLSPFRKLDKMKKGDEVVVEMPYGRFVYETTRTRIVKPTETSVTKNVGFDQLVLTACHPLYSAAQRIVLFARLVDFTPRGAAYGGLATWPRARRGLTGF